MNDFLVNHISPKARPLSVWRWVDLGRAWPSLIDSFELAILEEVRHIGYQAMEHCPGRGLSLQAALDRPAPGGRHTLNRVATAPFP